MVNLHEKVGNDFNRLAEIIATSLNSDEAISIAEAIVEGTPGAEVLANLDLTNVDSRRLAALLLLGSDCLNRIVQAICADGEVEDEELEVAYTLAGPIADLFAHVFDKYSDYSGLELEELEEFLNEFIGDCTCFGGHADRTAPYFGATLCCISSVVLNDHGPFDLYVYIIESILDGVMDGQLGANLNRTELRTVRRVKEYHDSIRATIVYCSTAIQNRSPSARSQLHQESLGSSGSSQIQSTSESDDIQITPAQALDRATNELNALIGLPAVKAEVKRLMSFLTVQQERQKHGLQASTQSLHFVFTGNPGTGKTTVARILGNILYGFGILKSPKMVECDRAKVVGGYLGQTAIKMDEVIQSAINGVLFIDEAYTLAGDSVKFGHSDMYGEEAINTLLKRMEDFRSRLVVIAAGYPSPMKNFLHSNPGLESRFTRFIVFEDYSVPDLCRIFDQFCRSSEYNLAPEACALAYMLFATAFSQRDERFGNARFVRNVYEQVVGMHSDRLAHAAGSMDKTTLVTIIGQDIPCRTTSDGFNPHTFKFDGCRWECACPGCNKISKASMKYLGQRVSCKCGQKFIFPWWCPSHETFSDVPASLLFQSAYADKVGVISVPSSTG